MMSATDHAITITAADGGAPTAARCSCGAWSWTRPAGDRWADTLPPAARAHRLVSAEQLRQARDADDIVDGRAAVWDAAEEDD
jgi:hypothetical protein